MQAVRFWVLILSLCICKDTIVSCYYKFGDALDPTICTHLMVDGCAVTADGSVTFLNTTAAKVIHGFKLKNPKLKISITGGGDMGPVLRNETKANKLADAIIQYLKQVDFDGFDMDWEILTWLPLTPSYKGLGEFFGLLREKTRNDTKQLVLTAAVFAVTINIDVPAYNVSLLNEHLDFINLMTYDFYQYLPTQPYTGHNSPLFKRPGEFWIFGRLNTAWSALNWYKNGMDHWKIAVGIPTYGHTYTLYFDWWHTIRAPATGPGSLGSFVTYTQVCHLLANASYSRVWDGYTKTPYCFKGKQWISYDDLESVAVKADWIKQQGFGGAMIWDFNHDDPRGECDGKTTFPLHRKIWSILKG